MATPRDIAAIKCPLCEAKELRFIRDGAQCRACGFAGPADEVARHIETGLEKLRTRLERLRHERQYNTEYLLRELAEARRACNMNLTSMAGAVLLTLAVGWALYPWQHSEYIYLTLICVAVVIPLAMKRRWLRGPGLPGCPRCPAPAGLPTIFSTAFSVPSSAPCGSPH